MRDTRLLRQLASMSVDFGLRCVTLSESAEIASPMVLGRAEVCVPMAQLEALSDQQIGAVFAHELAHIERWDGYWFPLVGLLESVLWFQPITHWVSERVRQSAELACDDRCVELTRQPLALARALTQLAANALGASHELVAPAMVPARSQLVARVKRLTHESHRIEHRVGVRALTFVAAGLLALLALSMSTGVRVAQASTAAPADADLAKRIIALARREGELERELATLSSSSTEQASDVAVRTLEAEQELEHARAMQGWLEQQMIHE